MFSLIDIKSSDGERFTSYRSKGSGDMLTESIDLIRNFWSFRPFGVRTNRCGLRRAQVSRSYISDNKVFRRHGIAEQTSKQGKLAGVRHRIGERSLKKTL